MRVITVGVGHIGIYAIYEPQILLIEYVPVMDKIFASNYMGKRRLESESASHYKQS